MDFTPRAFSGETSPFNARPAPVWRDLRGRGFTLIELLVALGILTVLLAITLPLVGRARAAHRNVHCLANLRQLAVGLRMYGAEFENYPDPASSGRPWEEMIGKFVEQRAVFRCPADFEVFPTLGSSYDWRDTGTPPTSLAGRHFLDVDRASLGLVYDALPAWHGRGQVNCAFLDGSARTISETDFFRDLTLPVNSTP